MNEVISPEPCKIIRLHGRDGNYKLTNNEIITVMLTDSNTQLKIKAPCKGIVRFTCREGDDVNESDLLCVLTPCPHDIVICGICGLCCAPIEITNMGNGDIKCNTGTRMAMVHNNKDLVVNERTAMELALKDSVNLLKKRKLSLLIDLDMTILHTTSLPVSAELADVYHYTLKDDRNRHEPINYHTKMRPYLKQFLERMHEKFELHIYTFGNRSYAERIREFIDPQKALFGQRVISRDDSFDPQKKTANLRSLFPRGDNMVVIIDDRPEVWSYAANLVHVRPFVFFADAGDINSPGGGGGGGRDVAREATVPPSGGGDEDDYLLRLETVLAEIHARFYAELDRLREPAEDVVRGGRLPDVKAVMRARRAEVLRGCRVAFSGLVPLSERVRDTQAYQALRALGGRYEHGVLLPRAGGDPQSSDTAGRQRRRYTTHLIAHSDGTKKVQQVGRYVREVNKAIDSEPPQPEQQQQLSSVHRVSMVNIYWLWHCFFLWARVDEAQFLFLPQVRQLPGPEGVPEDSGDDDDLSEHSACSAKRPSGEDGGARDPCKRPRSGSVGQAEGEMEGKGEGEGDPMAELDGAGSGVSTHSDDSDSDSSFDGDAFLSGSGLNVMLHYTPEQQQEMLREVDDALEEEDDEEEKGLRLTGAGDSTASNSPSSSSSSSPGSRMCRVKRAKKGWEEEDDDDENSSDEHGREYRQFGRRCGDNDEEDGDEDARESEEDL